MNKNKFESIKSGKLSKQAAGRHLGRAVGALLCVFLTGCGGADKALPIELGETLETRENVEESAGEQGAESIRQGDDAGNESGASTVLYIYVCGAVKEPGVVMLPEGSRCNDALQAAGGFAEDAAREAVNLAKVLSDGEQLYFPTVEEHEESVSAGQAADDGLVNINTAGEELLCTLPGIGEAKAKAIVLYREQNGDFGAVEDIMQVPGIKESAYGQMRDLITVK